MGWRAKNNWRTVKSIFNAWGRSIKRSSFAPANYLLKVLSKVPDAGIDLVQLGKEIVTGDIDQAFSEVLDIVNHLDIIELGIDASKEDVKFAINNLKQLGTDLKEIRKSNIENERKEKLMKKNTKKTVSRETTGKVGSGRSSIGKTNHPEWYTKDSTLLSSLVGINISNRMNSEIPFNRRLQVSYTGGPSMNKRFGISSVLGVRTVLTIPKSQTNDWEQGINLLYKNIRSANAGAINYSPAQLANYVYTIRTIDAALSTLGRAIKTLNSGSFYDAVSPQSYFMAVGLDYDTFAANAANVRELYNRLSAIRYRLMPLNISLLDRTRWLYSNYFKDSNDAKAQMYVPYFTKAYYIKSNNEPGVIVIADDSVDTSAATGLTWDKFSENILELFNVFQIDSIFQIIAGDILKAYGKEVLTHYPEISSSMTMEPVFDEHILMQLQNATISVTGNVQQTFDYDTSSLDEFVKASVFETVSTVASEDESSPIPPTQLSRFDYIFKDPVFNSNYNSLEANRILSATRLMTSKHGVDAPGQADTGTIIYDIYGSEIVEALKVVVFAATGKYGLTTTEITQFVPLCYIRGGNVSVPALDIPAWTWFDYFPLVIPYIADTDKDQWTYNPPLLDFNNFGIAFSANLESYNAICTLSMLHKSFVSRVNKTEVFEV